MSNEYHDTTGRYLLVEPVRDGRILCAHADDDMPMHWLRPGELCPADPAAQRAIEADRRSIAEALEARQSSPPDGLGMADLVGWYAQKCGRLAAEIEALASRLERRLG